MGLYQRLLQEAAELPEDPNQKRNERISNYLRRLRRPCVHRKVVAPEVAQVLGPSSRYAVL